MQYCELHAHTYYSMLDGLNSPAEYMKRANELGMTHMAITDHGTNIGHRDFQRSAKDAGIIPILGQEMYISATDRFDRRSKAKRDDGTNAYNHLIVLAQNANGLSNLNKLSQIGWTEGFYNKPRIDMEALEEHHEDLVVLSGCLNGLVCKALEAGNYEQAEQFTKEYKRIFGDRFFMEIQSHNPHEINSGLIDLADKHKVKLVVTSDCHFARKEDLWLEEAMLILSTNPKHNPDFDYSKSEKMEMLDRFNYAYPDRKMSFQELELFLHDAESHMASDWTIDKDRVEEGIANSMIVADMISDYPYYENLDLLPKPKNGSPDEILENMVWAGLERKGKLGIPEYDARAREELQIIKDKGFSTYFLIEAEGIKFANENNIRVGPGRGSGVGSLVNYALDVTKPDPIEHNLLFFRFVNPERNDFPDVDTDIMDSRRNEVKNFYVRKFKNVASILTIGTFAGKNSVRDAARVFRVPLGDVNSALKGADWPANLDFFEEWDKTDKGKAFARKYPHVIQLAKFMFGRPRSMGMHAGGLVVSNDDISKYAPMQSSKDTQDAAADRVPVLALDMEEAASVGFIKYDFLGLKALSIIQDTIDSIKDRKGIEIDPIVDIPLDDKSVYQELSKGYTKGVFQCEAVPYTNLLIKMGGVSNFDELVASNALVRPGAMNSSAGASFINRKEGREMIEYPHKDMHWFTKETYGVVIYQEQVMLTMTELAGMSMSDADKVRKIIGKKKDVSEFEEYKSKFIDGASKKVDAKVAEQLWHDFEAHAGYSFNKSHAVAYSMISYWTAWFKQHYPLEFMYAVLKNEKDKDSRLDYLIETKRLGVSVKLPHVNFSEPEFSIKDDHIRFGLNDIKYISDKISAKLIENRPYANYQELLDKANEKFSGINSRAIAALNAIGAATFDDNPKTGNERDNFYEYLSIPAFENKGLPPFVTAQFRTLDEFSESDCFVSMGMVRGIKTGTGWARVEIVDETGSCGVFTSEHHAIESGQMYVFLIANNRIARYISVQDLIDGLGGPFRKFLGATTLQDTPPGMYKVVAFNSRKTKAGKLMADVVFADEQKNMVSALVWPSNFGQAHTKCKEGEVVDVVLKELDDGGYAVNYFL